MGVLQEDEAQANPISPGYSGMLDYNQASYQLPTFQCSRIFLVFCQFGDLISELLYRTFYYGKDEASIEMECPGNAIEIMS